VEALGSYAVARVEDEDGVRALRLRGSARVRVGVRVGVRGWGRVRVRALRLRGARRHARRRLAAARRAHELAHLVALRVGVGVRVRVRVRG